MLLKDVALIVILIGIVATGVFAFWTDIVDNYDLSFDSEMNDTYGEFISELDTQKAFAEELQSDADTGVEESSTSVFGFSKVLRIIKSPFTNLEGGFRLLSATNKIIGVDQRIIIGVEAILLITVIFLVIGALMRGRAL